MSAYSIALFLHLVGVLALFAGIAIEQAALGRLRNARSLAQVREWMTLLRGVRRIDGPAGLTILVSGGYLAHSGGYEAWIGAGVLGMVAMPLIGIGFGRPRLIAIATALPATDGAVSSSLRVRLSDPILRASATSRAALALGIVFDMVVKPAAAGAAIALVVALVLGAATSLRGGVGARGAIRASE
jgi:hypothetical protein